MDAKRLDLFVIVRPFSTLKVGEVREIPDKWKTHKCFVLLHEIQKLSWEDPGKYKLVSVGKVIEQIFQEAFSGT